MIKRKNLIQTAMEFFFTCLPDEPYYLWEAGNSKNLLSRFPGLMGANHAPMELTIQPNAHGRLQWKIWIMEDSHSYISSPLWIMGKGPFVSWKYFKWHQCNCKILTHTTYPNQNILFPCFAHPRKKHSLKI